MYDMHKKESHKRVCFMKKNKKVRIAVIAVVLVAVIAVAVYVLIPKGNSGSSDGVYVQQISSLNGTVVAGNSYSGVVESQESLDIKKDSSREVSQIFVSEGQEVHAKDPLFSYDTGDLTNKIASANLDIEQANNEIEALRNQVSDYNAELNNGGDKVTITAQINETQYSIRQQQYQIQSLQADVARYQQEIDNSTVYSTMEGIVKQVNADGGTDQNGNELPFISITEVGEYRIKSKISEMGVISAGDSVIIRSRLNENETWKGTVSTVDTEPESNQNNNYYSSGSSDNTASQYPFYVSLESSDGLKLGQHVYVELDNGQVPETKEGVWIDSFYISYDEDGNGYVWVSENGKLKKRAVETGESDESTGRVEITSGLSNDDYIAWPDDSYTEGMKTMTDADVQASGE